MSKKKKKIKGKREYQGAFRKKPKDIIYGKLMAYAYITFVFES